MVKAEIILDGMAAMKPADIRAAGRAALRVVGMYWITNYLPLHFKKTAFQRYGYTPRNPSYSKRKRAGGTIGGVEAIGEDLPLVWSGRSRERSRNSRFALENNSGNSVAGNVIINAPALNFRPTGSRIDMRDEVTRVNNQEIRTLADVFTRHFEDELQKRGATKRRIRKVA
jgi:hypothetical protein